MTNAAKTGTVLVVVAVLIIVGLVWYFKSPSQSGLNTYAPSGSSDDMVYSNSGSVIATDPNDTSDTALTRDMGNIDTQMNGFDSDSASIDQGLNN